MTEPNPDVAFARQHSAGFFRAVHKAVGGVAERTGIPPSLLYGSLALATFVTIAAIVLGDSPSLEDLH